MTKKELIAKLTVRCGVSNAVATSMVDDIFESIKAAVAAGDTVSIPYFGKFKPAERKARKGRNPQTGEAIEIAAKTVPTFAPAGAFKDLVNE